MLPMAEVSTVLPALRTMNSSPRSRPYSSSGGTRRYSDRDLDRVRRVVELTRSGINLTGVEHVLRLGFIVAQEVEGQTVFVEVDRDPQFPRRGAQQ